MRFLKIILDFYINASIHVAFAVYAFLRITEIYFKLPNQSNLNYFVFFGTITGYNFVKYAGVAKLHHRSLTNSLKIIQIFSLVCFVAMCYCAFQLPILTLFYMVPLEVLTILYAVPFLSGFDKTLREVSYLKIVVVAIVWACFTVLIPLLNLEKPFSFNTSIFLIQRFLITVVLILPFDIRDVKYDAISLQTIPKKIGIKKTKKLGLILMVFSLIIECLLSSIHPIKTPFLIFFFLVIIFVMRAKTKQSKYYSSLFVESLPIVWWLVHLGFDNI